MKYIKKINPVVRNLLGLTIGTSIGSAAIAMFLAPAEIMGGGVAGVSILLYSVLSTKRDEKNRPGSVSN